MKVLLIVVTIATVLVLLSLSIYLSRQGMYFYSIAIFVMFGLFGYVLNKYLKSSQP